MKHVLCLFLCSNELRKQKNGRRRARGDTSHSKYYFRKILIGCRLFCWLIKQYITSQLVFGIKLNK